MTVYFDGIHLAAPGGGLEELHEFAAKIGLRRTWFQNHPRHPHYDVWGRVAKKALAAGAVRISQREMAELFYPLFTLTPTATRRHRVPCPHCGHENEIHETMRCPRCLREGCPECMPAGRGCICPECEEGDGLDD